MGMVIMSITTILVTDGGRSAKQDEAAIAMQRQGHMELVNPMTATTLHGDSRRRGAMTGGPDDVVPLETAVLNIQRLGMMDSKQFQPTQHSYLQWLSSRRGLHRPMMRP